MTGLVVHNSGPFYAYAPGEAIHRTDAQDSVPHVWAGLLTPVTDYTKLYDADKSGPYVAGMSADGKKTANRIWASHVRDLVTTRFGVRTAAITSLDRQPLVVAHDDFSVTDRYLTAFNRLICPHPVSFPRCKDPRDRGWDLPPELRSIPTPADVMTYIEQNGMLAYRRYCLDEAEKKAPNDEVGEMFRQAIYEMKGALLAYEAYANDYLNKEEDQIRQQARGQFGKAIYDDYDERLLWLLGRKAMDRGQQPIIVQTPAQVAEPQSAQMAEATTDVMKAMLEQMRGLQAEIESLKADRQRPKLVKRDSNARSRARSAGLSELPASPPPAERDDTAETV